ncbi:MAG: flagellar basal body P-ring formation protein FlgA [Deltaproteobacteria bacterium]|nr:flagellar basal body P-ring formation protein FlgA [Deltaproteobacteria bacterium]MBW2164702.1 flagellar basal body P-ring formation protein FlgA [Deltaproteobacteria bacterium]
MKTSKFFFVLILCLSLFSFILEISANLSAAGMTSIRVLKKAEIEDDKMLLGKIAMIKGEDSELVQKLRAIVVGSAPLPGKSRRIDEHYIKIRLKQNGVDLSRIILQVPEKNEISRGFIEISRERIEKIAMDFIYKKIPYERNRARVKEIRINRSVVLPKGSVTCKVVSPPNMDFFGLIPLSISFNVNGRFQKKVSVTVDIEVLTEVVVTKRPIGRYKMITEDDICLQKRDMSNLSSNIITNSEDVLGKRAKRTINAKTVLRADLVEFPFLVRRGDIVSIIAESDSLRITALGEVKEKGRKGQRIRVVNLDSKKGIYARVLDSNTVVVNF